MCPNRTEYIKKVMVFANAKFLYPKFRYRLDILQRTSFFVCVFDSFQRATGGGHPPPYYNAIRFHIIELYDILKN